MDVAPTMNRIARRFVTPILAATVAGLPLVALAATPTVESRITTSIKVNSLPKALSPSLADIHTKGYFSFTGGSMVTGSCDPYDYPEQANKPVPCILGDKTATRTVVLWGDSNAGNWMPLFDQVFASLKYRVAVFTFPGCSAPFVTASKTGPFVSSQPGPCNTFHSKLASEVRALQPTAIFGVSGAAFLTKTSALEQQWVAGWKSAFDAMTVGAPTTKRYVIGTSPIMPQDVPKCLALHSSAIQVCGINTLKSNYPSIITRDGKVATTAKATMIPVAQWFCQKNACPPVMDSILIYVDVDHTTKTFVAELNAPWLTYLRSKGF